MGWLNKLLITALYGLLTMQSYSSSRVQALKQYLSDVDSSDRNTFRLTILIFTLSDWVLMSCIDSCIDLNELPLGY